MDFREVFLKGENTYEILTEVKNGRLCYVDFVRKGMDTIGRDKHFLRSHIEEIELALNKFADENVVLQSLIKHGLHNNMVFLINYHEDKNQFVVIEYGFFDERDKQSHDFIFKNA